MKVVHEEKELIGQIAFTKEEARVAFGNDAVYLEKYLEKPRHVEVQVLGDSFGNFIGGYFIRCSSNLDFYQTSCPLPIASDRFG